MTITTCHIGHYFRADTYQLLDINFRIKFKVGIKEVIQLYTLYYFASFPLPLFGGIIVAKFGDINVLNYAKFMLYISSMVALYAWITVDFRYIQVAMSLHGLFSEFSEMIIRSIIAVWFKGKFLGFAAGLSQFFNSCSESSADLFTFKLMQKWRGIEYVLMFCCLLCISDCLMTILFQIFQMKKENYNRGVKKNKKMKEEFSIKMLRKMNNKQIWGMLGIVVISENIYYVLIAFTNGMLTKRFHFDSLRASNYMTILPISAVVTAPLIGILTVKIGRKLEIEIIAHLIAIFALIKLYFSPFEGDYTVGIYLSMIGVFFGAATTVNWAGLSLVVPEDAIPLAFGIAISLRNGLLSLFSYISGEIAEDEKKESFQFLILFDTIIAFFGLFFTIYTYFQDKRRGGVLSLPENSEACLGIKKIIDFRGNRREDILGFLKYMKVT